ncbi:MAG: hypothetical protein K8R11_10945 [Methanococcoides sp.]|nr:hypothetical protein [Methanococcoides sp.]
MEHKKDKKEKDIELPTLDDEIDSWCEISTEISDIKSADDLVIDEWCKGSEGETDTKKATEKKDTK